MLITSLDISNYLSLIRIKNIVKRTPYAPPVCEFNNYLAANYILAGSDLTDDGAGDFLQPGDEYTF